MKEKLTHEIRRYDLYAPLELVKEGFISPFVIEDEKKFVGTFSKTACKWFDSVIQKEFPGAVKVNDKTLVGYHWELNNLYWQLY